MTFPVAGTTEHWMILWVECNELAKFWRNITNLSVPWLWNNVCFYNHIECLNWIRMHHNVWLVIGSCEHANESWGFITGMQFVAILLHSLHFRPNCVCVCVCVFVCTQKCLFRDSSALKLVLADMGIINCKYTCYVKCLCKDILHQCWSDKSSEATQCAWAPLAQVWSNC